MKRIWLWATAALLAVIIPLEASAQRGGGGGRGDGGRGGGGVQVGGGGRGGGNVGGGGVRVGGGASGAVRANTAAPRASATVAPRASANVAPRASATVAPRASANVAPRANANVGAGVRASAPGASVRGTVPGADVRATVPGASVRGTVPSANVRTSPPGAAVRGTVPGADIRATVPGAAVRSNAGANVGNARTTLKPNTGADIRANVDSALPGRVGAGANAGVRANVPGVTGRAGADARVGGADARVGGADARVDADVRGRVGDRDNVRADADVRGRAGDRDNVRADADVRARANVRPSWLDANVGVNSRLTTNLNRTLAGAIGATAGVDYLNNNRTRANYWNGYGRGVNNYWRNNRYPYFNNNWWAGHNIWRPYGYFNYWGIGRPWGYWWGNPGWVGINRWYGGWGGWNSPYYYDYGYGGNVVYRDNYVYVDGQRVATAEDYAQSAAVLASYTPEDVPSQKPEDWLGLGTFAVVDMTDGKKDDVEPTRFVQLAVDKKGFISGSYFNRRTDEVFSLSGRVDKDTQRMAFALDEKKDIVFETGLFNLTQDEAPVLVHFGAQDTETMVFVRLEQPKDDGRREPTSAEQLP